MRVRGTAGAASSAARVEIISGFVERVSFHNESNGFCVLRVKVSGRREFVSVVGYAPSVSAGEAVLAEGAWVDNPSHGRQFSAHVLKLVPPDTEEGVARYLASGAIRGIGPVYARKLVSAFGARVFDVIENEPARLSDVSGLGPKRVQAILDAWGEQKVVREIMTFLYGHGVSTARAARIFKTYGQNAVQVVSDDPYRLARDIRGFGFATADAIAMKMGLEKTSLSRVRAGVSHALLQVTNDGHCGLPRQTLQAMLSKMLDIPGFSIDEGIDAGLADGDIVPDDIEGRSCLFLASLHRAEDCIAAQLERLSRGPLPWLDADFDSEIVLAKGPPLSEEQLAAIRAVLSSKLSAVTGGPGVGKTTILEAILVFLEQRGVDIALCAPTGRAAKRMSEATGREAKTIHRLLDFDPRTGRFRYGADHRLPFGFVAIDEMSMVDVPLMSALLLALPNRAAVLFVGDVDQLPSVGPGRVLHDIIKSGAIRIVCLTEVFRQIGESRIIANAHRVNVGLLPEFAPPGVVTDFYFISAPNPEIAVDRLVKTVCHRIPMRFGLDPVCDVQVLCPMNRGALGTQALNLVLQRALNAESMPRIGGSGHVFAVGDKVMQIENNYDKSVYNGDIGFISSIDEREGELFVNFGGRNVPYGLGELDELVLAYATTIHKSQGSEYPAVVIPLVTQHYVMLRRNLLYTGITRAKRLLILIGQQKALTMAVERGSDGRRWSRLQDLLSRSSVLAAARAGAG